MRSFYPNEEFNNIIMPIISNEEYQKTKTEEKSETVQIAPKEIKTAKQEQIEKINIRIYIISGIVLCVGIVLLLKSGKRHKNY